MVSNNEKTKNTQKQTIYKISRSVITHSGRLDADRAA